MTHRGKGISMISLLAFCVSGTNAAEVGRSELSTEAIVSLPPLLVQSDQVGLWHYGYFTDLQILSCCEEEVTRGFVHRFLRAKAEFAELVPEDFRFAAPEFLILVPPARAKSIAKEMSQLMQEVSTSSPTISHLRVSAEDMTATYLILDPESDSQAPVAGHQDLKWMEKVQENRQPDYLRFTLSAEYISDQLTAQHHSMLPCLVSGLIDTFEAASETANGMYSDPDTRLTMDDWRAVRFDSEAPRPLLPLQELLSGPPAQNKDARYRRLWRAEAELFVRWALFGRSGNSADTFWRFARESARQPVTEQLFHSCFGTDYADCRDSLSDYLPVATRNPARWSLPVPEVPKLWLRSAKLEEIDWIKGEWNRLILTAVKQDFPALVPQYQQKSLTMLTRAVDRDKRSSRLLASLGLLRVEMGDDVAGKAALEEAFAAGSKRPLALAELARLRFSNIMSTKHEADPKLTEAEANEVLALLAEALKSPQRLRNAVPLARTVFEHLHRQPTTKERSLFYQ